MPPRIPLYLTPAFASFVLFAFWGDSGQAVCTVYVQCSCRLVLDSGVRSPAPSPSPCQMPPLGTPGSASSTSHADKAISASLESAGRLLVLPSQRRALPARFDDPPMVVTLPSEIATPSGKVATSTCEISTRRARLAPRSATTLRRTRSSPRCCRVRPAWP